MELDHESVFLATPDADGYRLDRATFDTTRPNGVLLDADETTLFVAESPTAPTAGANCVRTQSTTPSPSVSRMCCTTSALIAASTA